ncbi:MAG: transcription elongation factor GreA [Clostridia bacterium]|nr:transcription elongation factor GreA [Clostridia bacterium]
MRTKDGLKKAQEELDYLINEKRKEVTEKIKVARSFGDLSENSEYDEAKNEQAMVEAKIAQLEAAIATAEIFEEENIGDDVITIGSVVKIYDCEEKETAEYRIVGAAEADPMQDKISDKSPLGAALLGHKAGDTVKVEAPAGLIKYKVKSISK